MFQRWKRFSIRESGLLKGFCDYHSHILPGVDDGVQSLEESIEILDKCETLGVKKVHLTPHIMEDLPGNTPENLLERFKQLRAAYQGDLELALTGEYMLDFTFWKRLKWGRIGNADREILVEFPLAGMVGDWEYRLDRILGSEHDIVLAHPERHPFLTLSDFQRLRAKGILLQLNLFALVGIYGSRIRDNADILLKNGFYDYIGTDTHSYESFTNCIELKRLSADQVERLEQLRDTGSR